MPSTTSNITMPPTTPKKVLSAIHNLPKRMRSGTLRNQAPPPRTRPAGKENVPPGTEQTETQTESRPPRTQRRRPAPLLPKSTVHAAGLVRDIDQPSPPSNSSGSGRLRSISISRLISRASAADNSKGAAKNANGLIVLKIWVPSTDDVWKLRVPEDVSLAQFRARVAAKVGFEVSFASITAGQLKTVADEAAFREWVAHRFQGGKNTPLTAHRVVLR